MCVCVQGDVCREPRERVNGRVYMGECVVHTSGRVCNWGWWWEFLYTEQFPGSLAL